MSTLIKWGCYLLGLVAVIFLVLLLANYVPTHGIGTPVVPTPPNTYFSDYPMNMEMRTSLPCGNEEVVLTHKVTYDGVTEKYRYYYRVELKGESVVLFEWDVLRAIGDRTLLELAPGKALEFSVEHETPPAMLNGNAMIYQKKDGEWKMTIKMPQLGPWPSGLLIPTGRETSLKTDEVQQMVK